MHDMGSEFCNNLAKTLHGSFGVDIRITSAGRPQPNGQAESTVRNIKAKMEAFMVEIGNLLFHPLDRHQNQKHCCRPENMEELKAFFDQK